MHIKTIDNNTAMKNNLIEQYYLRHSQQIKLEKHPKIDENMGSIDLEHNLHDADNNFCW